MASFSLREGRPARPKPSLKSCGVCPEDAEVVIGRSAACGRKQSRETTLVDIRTGSPSFGKWEAVQLDDTTHRCVYLSEGLGHAFMALEDNSTVVYLCSQGYAPQRDTGSTR